MGWKWGWITVAAAGVDSASDQASRLQERPEFQAAMQRGSNRTVWQSTCEPPVLLAVHQRQGVRGLRSAPLSNTWPD